MTEPTHEPEKPSTPEVPSYPAPPPPQGGSYPAPPPPGGAYPPPPPPQGGGYPAPPPMPYDYQGAPPAAPRNGLGTAALVLAIIGLLACWIPIFGTAVGVILGIIAVVLGAIGRGRVKRGEATNGGVSLAGLILGILAIVGAIVAIVLWYWLFRSVGGQDLVDCLNKAGNDTAKQEQCQEQFDQNLTSKFSITTTPGR
ncbi:MAG: hypothetical protein QOC62_4441 [Mycobacterium sp.]|nr:hypothetical protein [Mycobacterium sp.]